jgi:hypothetical protein
MSLPTFGRGLLFGFFMFGSILAAFAQRSCQWLYHAALASASKMPSWSFWKISFFCTK